MLKLHPINLQFRAGKEAGTLDSPLLSFFSAEPQGALWWLFLMGPTCFWWCHCLHRSHQGGQQMMLTSSFGEHRALINECGSLNNPRRQIALQMNCWFKLRHRGIFQDLINRKHEKSKLEEKPGILDSHSCRKDSWKPLFWRIK